MKHKVGDTVKIRSWKSMKNEFGVNPNGDIPTWAVFTKCMRHLCQREVTINDKLLSGRYRGAGYYLDDWMFDEQ